MKDYRLSEIKNICSIQLLDGGGCKTCEIKDFCCFQFLNHPSEWCFENSSKAIIKDTGFIYCHFLDWVEKYCPEYLEDYKNTSFGEIGDVVEIITSAPHLWGSPILYLVKHKDYVTLIGEDGLFFPEKEN